MVKNVGSALIVVLGLSACQGTIDSGVGPDEEPVSAESGEFEIAPLQGNGPAGGSQSGVQLFRFETFDGNGRTCETCHGLDTGQISLEEIAEAFADDPNDPLFRAIDSDDGTGASYSRLLANSTFMVEIPLPPNIRLADDPTATTVKLFRTTLTNNNVFFENALMWDGREPNLESQALSAIGLHAEVDPSDFPSQSELEAIADFQEKKFFSSKALKKFAKGNGPAPALPPGRTESEKRGREFFVPKVAIKSCGFCHAGPLLNEGNEFTEQIFPAFDPGFRFSNTFVSIFNEAGLPVRTWIVTKPDGTTQTLQSADLGRALITGNIAEANRFKIPSLWNAKDTAPYFHDGSAKTLRDVVEHYDRAFEFFGVGGLTEQEMQDIEAYLKLL